jgi:glycine reductase
MPVAFITAMAMLAKQFGANRIIATGTKIPHPCGDPNLPAEGDKALRREIVKCALGALETDVEGPTVLVPNVTCTSG